MIHTHTMTQLKTVQDPMKLLWSSNAQSNTSVAQETITTTQPTTTGGAVVIPASTLNYIKILPLLSSASNSPTIRVTGWNKSETGNYWIPQLLYFGALSTVAGSGIAINSTTMYPVQTFSKTDGDAKIYSSSSTSNSTGFLIIDTLGCQLIKIEFGTTTTANTVNAFIGAI